MRFIRYGLFGLFVLSALGRNELGPSLWGLGQGSDRFNGPAYSSSFDLASWAWVMGLRAYFLKPHQLPPSPWLQRAWASVVSLLGSGATSTWLLRAGVIRALSPSNILG